MSLGRLFGPVATFSILRRVSIPSITRPNTTCFPSRKSHLAVVMKNWHPFVLGPEFAYDTHQQLTTHIRSVAVYHRQEPRSSVFLLEVLVLEQKRLA